jgi:hypothetical protein
MKKLNVGCGPHHIRPDWINMDLRPFKGVDAVRDATKSFDDLGPFDYIYCEHFLEHLDLGGAIKFLRNCFTSLVVGGRFRLSTPSLEFVILTHFDTSQSDEEKTIQQTFGMNRAFHGWGHQFLWSKILLSTAVRTAGFSNIMFHQSGESEIDEFKGIERHGGFRHHLTFPNYLILECVKDVENAPEDPAFLDRAKLEYIRYVESGH